MSGEETKKVLDFVTGDEYRYLYTIKNKVDIAEGLSLFFFIASVCTLTLLILYIALTENHSTNNVIDKISFDLIDLFILFNCITLSFFGSGWAIFFWVLFYFDRKKLRLRSDHLVFFIICYVMLLANMYVLPLLLPYSEQVGFWMLGLPSEIGLNLGLFSQVFIHRPVGYLVESMIKNGQLIIKELFAIYGIFLSFVTILFYKAPKSGRKREIKRADTAFGISKVTE